MTIETKYTKDGRKVGIINVLNSSETIVQEVYVDDQDNEVLAGDQFVVRDLLDKPLRTFQQRELERIEERIARLKKQESEAEAKTRHAEQELRIMKDIVTSSKCMVNLMTEDDLDLLASVMTGSVEYLVVKGYGLKPPVRFRNAVARFDSWDHAPRYEGLKLISVLGNSEGKLEYRLHQYGDTSGGQEEIYPFKTWDDAITFVKSLAREKLAAGRLTIDEFKMCTSFGITFSEEEITKFKQDRQQHLKERQAAVQKTYDTANKKVEDELADMNAVLETL